MLKNSSQTKRLNFYSILLNARHLITVPIVIRIINVFAFFLLAWVIGYTAARTIETELFTVPVTKLNFIVPTNSTTDRALSFSENFQNIIDKNIFDAKVGGIELSEESFEPELVPGATIQQVLSKLKLKGFSGGRTVFAFIENKTTRSEDIFGINDELFDTQAFVIKIFTRGKNEGVHIKIGEEIGVLGFEKDEKTEKEKAKQPQKSALERRQTQKKSRSIDSRNSPYSTNGKDFTISSAEVDQQLNDFSKLLNQARVEPSFVNGEHIGYKIRAIDKGSLYEKLGLKNNDVIQQINGENIDSPEKAFGLLKMLRNEREINLKIKRGNNQQNLNYHIR